MPTLHTKVHDFCSLGTVCDRSNNADIMELGFLQGGDIFRRGGGCFFLQNFGEKRDHFFENPHNNKECVVWHHYGSIAKCKHF